MSPRSVSRRLAPLTVTATVLLAAGACGDDGASTADDRASTAASGTSTSATPSPATGSASGSPSSSAATGDTHAESVYDIGSTPQGPRLYREFRSATGEASLDSALNALTDTPADPDYRTAWSPGAFDHASVAGDQIDVFLADQSLDARPGSMSPREAKLAIQQVVYTAQAAAQRRLPVQFLIADAPAASVLGVSTTDPIAAGDEIGTLALVNITTPEQDQDVSGSFTASGVASSFEGTVAWQILDGAGTVVAEGSAQGTMDFSKLTPWQTDVDVSSLAPGDYTFVAMTDDPTGGSEGPGPTKDTKAITVS